VGLSGWGREAGAGRAEINGWVRRETADKITALTPPGVLGRATRLVLANAIYFQGTWARQFAKSATQAQPFHTSAGRTVQVPLMFEKVRAGYAAHPDMGLKVLELPYNGDDL